MLATSAGALHSWYSRDLYVRAALLSEAYSSASGVKTQVSDHFIKFGVMPNSNVEANLPSADSFFGTSVWRVGVRQGGVVEVDFDKNGEVGTGSIIFSPLVSPVRGHIYWQCSSDSIDRDVLRKLRPACDYKPVTLESELITAINKRNLLSVDKLMNKGVNLDGFTNGITPLMHAASIDDPKILNRMIERGVDVNLQANNHDGLTALMIAIRMRRADIASLLLASGASITVGDNHGRLASYHAEQIRSRFGDDRFSTLLLQKENPQFLSHPAESSPPAFTRHNSAHSRETLKQKLRMLGDQCLNKAGADLTSQVREPCETAISKLSELSLEHLASGLTTLNVAIEVLAESILLEYVDDFVTSSKQINAEGAGVQTSLITAISVNKPEFAALLIARGADVNALSYHGSRPLIEASKLGNAQLVTQLMTEGADLNAADSLGRTSLLAAVGRGHHSVVDTLIQAGAETRAKDVNGIDALLLAKSRRFFAIERLLLTAKETRNSAS